MSIAVIAQVAVGVGYLAVRTRAVDGAIAEALRPQALLVSAVPTRIDQSAVVQRAHCQSR